MMWFALRDGEGWEESEAVVELRSNALEGNATGLAIRRRGCEEDAAAV